jgi:hypothetical protein
MRSWWHCAPELYSAYSVCLALTSIIYCQIIKMIIIITIIILVVVVIVLNIIINTVTVFVLPYQYNRQVLVKTNCLPECELFN